jgi:hypothetical protein
MKYTLLELTQSILSSMDSDEVNSINDTVESQQVVEIVKTVYNDLITRSDLSASKTLFTLTASGDNAKPVLMTKPDGISTIDWLRYNCEDEDDDDPVWRELYFLPLSDFLSMTQNFNPSETDIESMTHAVDAYTITFNYYNDRGPSYYTSINDNDIIFDAYDAEVDTTLQSSKTLGFGGRSVVFSRTDAWTPELEPDQFALLLNEAKSLAWAELKQTPNPKAEQAARRNWIHLGRTRRSIKTNNTEHGNSYLSSGPNFGRRR